MGQTATRATAGARQVQVFGGALECLVLGGGRRDARVDEKRTEANVNTNDNKHRMAISSPGANHTKETV
jgi:hypothetical protein